jgi:hypothetical protein
LNSLLQAQNPKAPAVCASFLARTNQVRCLPSIVLCQRPAKSPVCVPYQFKMATAAAIICVLSITLPPVLTMVASVRSAS